MFNAVLLYSQITIALEMPQLNFVDIVSTT